MKDLYFDPVLTSDSTLSRLLENYGSDKGSYEPKMHFSGWRYHSYSYLYSLLLGPLRQFVTHVLEVGIGSKNHLIPSSMGANGIPGASLRAWRDYFPNASVVGLDVDEDCLFSEERITTYICDQTSPESISNVLIEIESPAFDIIIDDGLHTYAAAKTFFQNSNHLLKQNGLYFIEDAYWTVDVLPDFIDENEFEVTLFRPRIQFSPLDAWDKMIVIQRK